MRITRAYTITPEIKRILDTKANKSEYVCRAVRKMHLQQEELDLVDVPTRQLIAAAISRDDIPSILKSAMIAHLTATRSIS